VGLDQRHRWSSADGCARTMPLMYNRFAWRWRFVHVFLPFMVLSLTGVLKRIDPHALEAALPLGASPRRLPGGHAGAVAAGHLAGLDARLSLRSPRSWSVLLGGFKVPGAAHDSSYEQVLVRSSTGRSAPPPTPSC